MGKLAALQCLDFLDRMGTLTALLAFVTYDT
jgi:hypothetical protein